MGQARGLSGGRVIGSRYGQRIGAGGGSGIGNHSAAAPPPPPHAAQAISIKASAAQHQSLHCKRRSARLGCGARVRRLTTAAQPPVPSAPAGRPIPTTGAAATRPPRSASRGAPVARLVVVTATETCPDSCSPRSPWPASLYTSSRWERPGKPVGWSRQPVDR